MLLFKIFLDKILFKRLELNLYSLHQMQLYMHKCRCKCNFTCTNQICVSLYI